MKIAQDWKIVEHLDGGDKITVKTKNLGHYTEATAREKMAAMYPAPNWRFRTVPSHGFGGYWVHVGGDTAQCIPGKA